MLLKGGTTAGGARAAASHTGALAADDKVFDGECRAAGVTRAATVEEAFEAAATLATQPAPRGPRVAVVTTAGGWGVVTADAITRDPDLQLVELPPDLEEQIDKLLPARWSRSNPIDCAGGETRDTIPDVLRLVAEHDAVDAVILLGLGIQSNQARMMRDGPFYPDHGLARIVEFHDRQDARYATAAAELSESTGKPILAASELAVADPDNPGPATVRATGRLCYASGNRAVTALGHLWRDAEHRRRRAGQNVNRRGTASSPLIVLAAVVLLPAVALFGLWRLAAGQDREIRRVVAADHGGRRGTGGAHAGVEHATAVVPPNPRADRARSQRRQLRRRQSARSPASLDSTSCLVVQLDGVEVGAHNPDLPVIPASNQKLLVAAAALEVLGPDHVFTTEVRGGPVNGGVLAGDLYLVGGGDPLLTTDDYPAAEINGYPVLNATSLDTLADSVAAAGITHVDGNLVADGSRYDDEWFHPSWPDDIHVTEAGPLDALLVNDARFLTDDWQVANDPNAGAAEELGRLLEERGITIGGEVTTGTAPADAARCRVDRLATASGGDRRDAGVE